MSSGMDDAYKMECESRRVKALQRKYARGSAKRAIVTMIQEARVRLIAARTTFEALELDVQKDEEKTQSAFHEERWVLGQEIRNLDRLEKDVENLGVDLQEVIKEHKHHYATNDPDQGCSHCGMKAVDIGRAS